MVHAEVMVNVEAAVTVPRKGDGGGDGHVTVNVTTTVTCEEEGGT